MSMVQAFIALNRFGFGARPGELQAVARDPGGWLSAQIRRGHAASPVLRDMPGTAQSLKTSRDTLAFDPKSRRMMREEMGREAVKEQRKEGFVELRRELGAEIFMRTKAAVESDTPFLERLVHFWSNHFTVSVTTRHVMALCGPFERDVIRPNILGNFTDLVLASSRHPAMLFYLDQAQSIGPNAPANRQGKRGLNENLAREILELHTLGVDGGYTQTDVREFAKMLTGWTIDLDNMQGDDDGFVFRPIFHEPGRKTLLGRTYEGGEGEAEQAIRDVCAHPSTAKFVATKLARHFIADDPPRSAVDRLAAVFMSSRGDLKRVTETLVSLPEVWREPLPKVKTPNDLIISSFRAVKAPLEAEEQAVKKITVAYKMFNQVPYSAPSPAGWADESYAWVSSEAMMRRVSLAQMMAMKLRNVIAADTLLEQTIGPVASDDTRQAVRRAPSPVDALALLFASPEFQRR